LQLVCGLLCERRVVLVAAEDATLRGCTAGALALLYPFTWRHPFHPMLPRGLFSLLRQQKQPYLYGIRSETGPSPDGTHVRWFHLSAVLQH